MGIYNSTEKQYLQKDAMEGRVYHPLIRVSFHTKNGLYHASSKGANMYGEEVDPNNQVLSVMTQKTLESPAGMWTMTLAGYQWARRLRSQDLTVIQMGYAGERELTTVMVGLVDRTNKKRSMGGDGKPQVSTIVTGRDFGKLFVKDLLKFYPEISGKNASDFFLTDVGWVNLMKVFTTDNIMKGTPGVIITNIMKHIFPKVHDISWTLWDEGSNSPSKKTVNVSKILTLTLGKTDLFMPFIFTADQYEGSLWNLLQRVAPQTFTELFIDTRDDYEFWHGSPKNRLVPHDVEKDGNGGTAGTTFSFGKDKAKVVLCLRKTPFDSVHKDNLVHHTILERDVISEDLTRSDDQHYNLFWAGTAINPLGIDLKRVAPPLLNEAEAKKFGLSPLEVTIEGMEITDQEILEGMSKTFTGKLKTWFQYNHDYWQGSLEIRGKASIRIGQMVDYSVPGEGASADLEFYVEGVTQNYNVFQGWTTSLTLTRGMKKGTKLDSSAYDYKPPAPKSASAAAKSTFYTVQRGDTLWYIAKNKYGDPLKWRKIWEANKNMLIERDKRNATDNGHWIYPGQKLTIPAK